jgi:large subunit ribosomal protein L17
MADQLIQHERIETTVPKAKELRRVADRMITLGKEGTLAARRRARAILRTDASIIKLFGPLAERYKEREGGYTRVTQTRTRVGDAAKMAYIEYVDRVGELRPSKGRNKVDDVSFSSAAERQSRDDDDGGGGEEEEEEVEKKQ